MNTVEFAADNFTPTKWEGAEQKARFARRFVRFVEADFSGRQFTQGFYKRLSLTFGHIAHYNRHSFFETFFASTAGKVRFLRLTLQHGCWGDPAFTYSDVERALQAWLRRKPAPDPRAGHQLGEPQDWPHGRGEGHAGVQE